MRVVAKAAIRGSVRAPLRLNRDGLPRKPSFVVLRLSLDHNPRCSALQGRKCMRIRTFLEAVRCPEPVSPVKTRAV